MIVKKGKTNLKNLLIMVILAAIAVGGLLVYQNLLLECISPSDCEGRIHIMCVGKWECINNKCAWNCRANIGNELEKADLIKTHNPRPNQAIESPLFVKGQARGGWYFEADFPVKVFDDNGFLLGAGPAQALGDWMTNDFVEFSSEVAFAVPSTSNGRLILEKDNPSGLLENADELTIPVCFKEAQETSQEFMAVKIFLSDSAFAGEPHFDCSRAIAVERQVPKSQAIAKSAMEALLRGATEKEIKQGIISNINPGVRVQKLTIENGLAKIDFDEQLEFLTGGSCRVAAIRSQITETLKQFSTVNEVIVSINGRAEDILQP